MEKGFSLWKFIQSFVSLKIIYSRFTKNATILGSIIEGEVDFGATLGVKQANLHGIVQLLSSGWTT